MSACEHPTIDQALRFIGAAQDRTAFYTFASVSAAIADGQVPNLSRRGWRIFYQHRRTFRVSYDLRAIEAELPTLAVIDSRQHEAADGGMTIQQFAEFFGIDRGALAAHLTEIPSAGPAPMVPAGRIPFRRVGRTRRIFKRDVFGGPELKGVRHDSVEKAASNPTGEEGWRRSLDRIRDF
jgi:hypothetical protein